VSDLDRYEVIAEFPASIMSVGNIISVYRNTGTAYVVKIDDNSEKYDVRDYPHLFRKLI